MRHLRMGWDVGGWHCDKNRQSRDALAVLEKAPNELQCVGRLWRGNLRSLLVSRTGADLVSGFLSLCGISLGTEGAAQITIAIDTPLGWPRALVELLNSGKTTAVAEDRGNPYTRRQTEIELIKQGIATPLSPVRDMIGSQSTKGIHFLKTAHLNEQSTGVWVQNYGALSVAAIETYPAAAVATKGINGLWRSLEAQIAINIPDNARGGARSDFEDAVRCAIVAHLFSDEPEKISQPPAVVPPGEGWIVLPRSP